MNTSYIRIIICSFILLTSTLSFGSDNVRIVQASSIACLKDFHTIGSTEKAAILFAKREALESVRAKIQSATVVRNDKLESDRIEIISNSQIELIDIISKDWTNDAEMGKCVEVTIIVSVQLARP